MSTWRRVMAASVVVFAGTVLPSLAQAPAPELSRQERAALRAAVEAAGGSAALEVEPDDWPIHVLRASDGSHYVAFSLINPPGLRPGQPVALYVRLATRTDPRIATRAVERSAVAEWLAGTRSAPPPRPRALAFGDMPTYGAGSAASRLQPSQNLQLLELERERARERREEAERERRARLEGAPNKPVNQFLPFEDFEPRVALVADDAGETTLRRSLTAGAGAYELTVAWADPTARDVAATVRVIRRALDLPAATRTDFSLSSVILADDVRLDASSTAATEQSKQPYSIGPMRILPARDALLTPEERLALVVQVINPRGGDTGKPDVAVSFRVFRRSERGEEMVGTLAPQFYNASTLPADFDVVKGHPIFAAVGVPLAGFRRGEHRLEIGALDRLAGVGATTAVTFTVTPTPASLLREAPPLARPFRRDAILQPPLFETVLAALTPARPSAALASALAAGRAGRFIELVRDEAVPPEESGTRAMLRALALYALGDNPASVFALAQQALEKGASPAAGGVLIGAVRALEGNDREAAGVWQAAADAGLSPGAIALLRVPALLRLGDQARGVEIARAAVDADASPALRRQLGTAYLAAGRTADAIAIFDPLLAEAPDDQDVQWQCLQALFNGFVSGTGPGADEAGRARILTLAERYAASGAPNAALAREWAAVAR